MGHLISISENIAPPDWADSRGEVYATAEADFDQNTSRLRLKLESYTWKPGFEGEGHQLPGDWLPQSRTVTESVSMEEATQVAQRIFNDWVRHLQRKIAQLPEHIGSKEEESRRNGPAVREPAFSAAGE